MIPAPGTVYVSFLHGIRNGVAPKYASIAFYVGGVTVWLSLTSEYTTDSYFRSRFLVFPNQLPQAVRGNQVTAGSLILVPSKLRNPQDSSRPHS